MTCDQFRSRTFRSDVPEASLTSVAYSPVSLNRMKSTRQQDAADARSSPALPAAARRIFGAVKPVSAVAGLADDCLDPTRSVIASLRRGALVTPQDRRADHLIAVVQEHGAVHLTREADA